MITETGFRKVFASEFQFVSDAAFKGAGLDSDFELAYKPARLMLTETDTERYILTVSVDDSPTPGPVVNAYIDADWMLAFDDDIAVIKWEIPGCEVAFQGRFEDCARHSPMYAFLHQFTKARLAANADCFRAQLVLADIYTTFDELFVESTN